MTPAPQPVETLPTAEAHAPPPPAQPTPSAAPGDAPSTPLSCAACGTRLPAGADFCSACGAPTAPAPAPSLAAVAAARSDNERRVALGVLAVSLIVGALLVAGGALLAARLGGWPPASPAAMHTLTGSLDLLQSTGTRSSNYDVPDGGRAGCVGLRGYADVRTGMQIRVEDETGRLIGQGGLEQGELTMNVDDATPACTFAFSVPDLPEAERYRVGSGSRGTFAFTREELDAAGWEVTLTLGP